MSISSISSNPLAQALATELNLRNRDGPVVQRAGVSSLPGDSGGVSSFARIYSKLELMASSDPEKFKSVASKIAGYLKDAAGGATGPVAEFLKNLSERFEKASQSGDSADLHPPDAVGAAANGESHRHRYHGMMGASGPAGDGESRVNLEGLLQTIWSQANTT